MGFARLFLFMAVYDDEKTVQRGPFAHCEDIFQDLVNKQTNRIKKLTSLVEVKDIDQKKEKVYICCPL